MWNTIIRGDHQVNDEQHLQRALAARAVAAGEPDHRDRPQATAPAAAREESDVDQTVSVSLNRVLSNTKVSTVRLTWTRENVTFANNCFNTNGRDMTQCPVTLAFQDYIDQQDNTAQARINDGIQLEETLAWFLPHRHGDHDVKFGVQYEFTNAYNTNQGNLNGTLLVRPQQCRVQRGDSVDLSGSPVDTRRRAADLHREGALPRVLRCRTSGAWTTTSR